MARFKGLSKRQRGDFRLFKLGVIETDRLPKLRALRGGAYGWDRRWFATIEVEGADSNGQHLIFLKMRSRYGDHIKAAKEMAHRLVERAKTEPFRVPLMTRSPAKLKHLQPEEINGSVPHSQPEETPGTDAYREAHGEPVVSRAPKPPRDFVSRRAPVTTSATPPASDMLMRQRRVPNLLPGEMWNGDARDLEDLEDSRATISPRERWRGF
jgi:hypothetical protein